MTNKMCTVRNDLVLSSNRNRSAIHSDKNDNVRRNTPEASNNLCKIQKKKFLEVSIDKSDDLKINVAEKQNKYGNKNLETERQMSIFSNENIMSASDKLTFSYVEKEILEDGDVYSRSPQQMERSHSVRGFESKRKFEGHSTETCSSHDYCRRKYQHKHLGNQILTASREASSDITNWASVDTAAHFDLALDQAFEESMKECQGRPMYMIPPQNRYAQYESCENKQDVHLALTSQTGSFISDLQPAVRKRTRVGDRGLKLVEVEELNNADSPVDNMLHPAGQREDLPTCQGNLEKTLPVIDLQPSVRCRMTSLCRTGNKKGDVENITETGLPTSDNNSAVETKTTKVYRNECIVNTKEKHDNTSSQVAGKIEPEFHQGNVCIAEPRSTEKTRDRKERRVKSIRRQRDECDGKTARETDRFAMKRKSSKRLEESGSHSNHEHESCFHGNDKTDALQGFPMNRGTDIDKTAEDISSSLQKNSEISKSNALMSRSLSCVLDGGSGIVSKEDSPNCSQDKKTNTDLTKQPCDATILSFKRKRFNSGPDVSKRVSECTRFGRERVNDKTKCIKDFKVRSKKMKSKTKGRKGVGKHKNESRIRNEQGIIHKIHETLAESSNYVKDCVGELNKTGEVGVSRIADLENMIPLDVLSDDLQKRKAKLKLEKARGALYRQISSDGIWSSVKSKY